ALPACADRTCRWSRSPSALPGPAGRRASGARGGHPLRAAPPRAWPPPRAHARDRRGSARAPSPAARGRARPAPAGRAQPACGSCRTRPSTAAARRDTRRAPASPQRARRWAFPPRRAAPHFLTRPCAVRRSLVVDHLVLGVLHHLVVGDRRGTVCTVAAGRLFGGGLRIERLCGLRPCLLQRVGLRLDLSDVARVEHAAELHDPAL